MPRRVVVYVLTVIAFALSAWVALYSTAPEINNAYVYAAITFAALGFLLHAFDFTLSLGASGSSAMLPFLTAMFLAPHWTTVIAIAGTVAIKESLSKREPLKKLFNVSQSALSASAAILVFLALGGEGFADVRRFEWLPYVALYVVCIIANTLGVSAAVALSQGQPVHRVWRENTLSTAPFDVLSLPFVYVFASVYTTWGWVGALGLALPLLGVRQLYKTNWQLERINRELLELMVAAIEARDPYTSGHSRRVSRNAKIIARAVGLPAKQVDRVGIAALLHDVGKIHEVFAPILRKPGQLSPEERAIMETHPAKSAELVQNVSTLKDIVPAVRHHHENWDGSGYPEGLARDEIPLFARVIMIADTVDAMTTDRPYRRAMSEDDVRGELVRMSGRQFDPSLVNAVLAGHVLSSLLTTTGDRSGRMRRYTPTRPSTKVVNG
jgi:putative nucleotidyltransferase with HDIG domain